MPTSQRILESLAAIANGGSAIAVLWHAIVLIVIAVLATGWRPSCRTAIGMLSMPAVSVAVASGLGGNPFNAVVFGTLALALLGAAGGASDAPISAPSRFARRLGLVMLAFGWVYPHFLEGSVVRYLYAAPLGLIPCPTLSAMIGATLLGGAFASTRVGWLLVATGAFYAVFGIVRLGVALDAALLVGAFALALELVTQRRRLSGA